MGEWQDISTAPKDGIDKPIIGLDAYRRVFKCWWQPEFDAWISGARVMTMAGGYTIDGQTQKLHSPEIETPRHWVPFPTFPPNPLRESKDNG